MSISYYQLIIDGNCRTLDNLNHLADKAIEYCQKNKIEESALLTSRLFPDMFPLWRQFHMVCVMSACAAAWLTGKVPPMFEEGEKKSFAEIKAEIAQAKQSLKSYKSNDFAQSATCEVRLPWNPDHALVGEVFLLQHALPNIYFHLTTAYALLRHNGVPIGKSDYLGKL